MKKILLAFVLIVGFMPLVSVDAACMGQLPENTQSCGQGQGNYHYVEMCSNEQCTFMCKSGYERGTHGCVAICRGVPQNAERCDEDPPRNPTSGVYVDDCDSERWLQSCSYMCKAGYSTRGCLPPECIGAVRTGTILCEGDDQKLIGPVNNKLVEKCTDNQKCEYKCREGYFYHHNGCVALECRGDKIKSAKICDGDNDVQSFADEGVSWSEYLELKIELVTKCTNNRKCEYTCQDGYVKSGDECVADKCPDNLAPELKRSDPACFTSTYVESGYNQVCSWSADGVVCDTVSADGSWGGSTYNASSCNPSSYPSGATTSHGTRYVNSCGGAHCTNAGDPPDAGGGWVDTSHTDNTCYYITVAAWSKCDPTTGTQSATHIKQNSVEGKDCANLNEDTTRICGICDPTTNGKGTGTAPEPEEALCFSGDADPVPPTLNTTTNMWEWTCDGVNEDTTQDTVVTVNDENITSYSDDMICSAPRNETGECAPNNPGAQGEYAYNATEFRGDLCAGGTPTISRDNFNTVLPTPSVGAEPTTVIWDCIKIGDNPEHNDMLGCSATRNGPQPGMCSKPNHDTEIPNKPTEQLCCNPNYLNTCVVDDIYLSGNVSNLTDDKWTWKCSGSKNATPPTAHVNCEAGCVPDLTWNIKPNPYPIPKSGNSVNLEVSFEAKGECANNYTCQVNGQDVTGNGDLITITVNIGTISLTVDCPGDKNDKPISISGYCTQKECNGQGTCQAIPRSATSLGDCSSTCNSNADCSRGRMIETRP